MLYNRGHDPEYKLFEFFFDTFAYAGEFFEWNRKGRGVVDDSSADYDFYVEMSEEIEPEDFCAFLGKLDNVTAKIISGRDVCVSVHIPEGQWIYDKLVEIDSVIKHNTIRVRQFLKTAKPS